MENFQIRNATQNSPLPSVAVAMSGGVDSSVTAALLHERGHRVVGFTLKLWDAEDEEHARKVCCTTVMARDAGWVCGMLGMPHYTLDLRETFRREVIDRFESEYLAGRTPNPCVHCNSRVKWGALWDKAQALGMDRIATGHYARIETDGAGRARLLRGKDPVKDQSYFLWEIPQHLLQKTMFPLGDLEKAEVRDIARRFDLPVAEKEESQEVCFVPADDYRGWLLNRRPELKEGALAGEMVDPGGKVLAQHPGFPFFTIGQRKGLGLGGGRKYYVTGIDPATKRVHLGDVQDLDRGDFHVRAINRLSDQALDGAAEFEVKIRYRDPGFPARVEPNGNGSLKVTPQMPVRAVTPGQSAVVYLGDEVVAGGIIE